MSAPELSGLGSLRYLWRQLTSMRTALILLLLLGVAAIPGSLLPQRTQNPMKVREYFTNDPTLAQWLDRFKFFDVYGSPWFSAIYLLLFISLIGCVLPRSWEHAKAIRAKPVLTPKNLDRMDFYRTFDTTSALDSAEAWFKKNRFRIQRNADSISAEKGYSRETGNVLFHLSLIVILIGIALSSSLGMNGSAIVNVGERFINTPTSYDNLTTGRFFSSESLQHFTITADKFVAQYNPITNAPEDYTLSTTISKSVGGSSEKKVLKVNSPLTFGSTRVYLQANGYSPIVTVTDQSGTVVFQGPVPFLPQDANLTSTGAIKVPDAQPQIGFIGSFVPTIDRSSSRGAFSAFPEALDPRLLVSVWEGDLQMDSGIPQSVYRLDTNKMARIGLKEMKLNETYSYGVGTITFNGFTPWVNLQIVRDPGKQYALIGSILAILGLLTSLFTRQRRIWVKVGKKVEIAGLAKNAIDGLESELNDLTDWIERFNEKEIEQERRRK
jgi:cytochrome c biogenesis protein